MYQKTKYQIRAKRNRAKAALKKLGVDEKLIECFDIYKSPVLFDINNLPYSISISNEPELHQIIREFERKSDCLVYGVVREPKNNTRYTFLIISNRSEDWGEEIELPYIYAYTYYKKNPNASEFGSVEVYFENNKVVKVADANYFGVCAGW
jgi:hypothetical protein